MKPATMKGTTIPHEAVGRFGGAQVLLRPASEGTGVIAGGSCRAVLELAGVRDVLAKSLGSSNKLNVTKATMAAIASLRSREEALAARGK
jgi:small subunit ribosomal protein S5